MSVNIIFVFTAVTGCISVLMIVIIFADARKSPAISQALLLTVFALHHWVQQALKLPSNTIFSSFL